MKISIIISVVISIVLHVAILLTYPAINLAGKRNYQEDVTVSFLEIAGEDFSRIREELSARGPARFNLLKNGKVWEVSWPVIDIELLAEPEDISSFLKNGDKELLGIEILEKETPPLTEELEAGDGK